MDKDAARKAAFDARAAADRSGMARANEHLEAGRLMKIAVSQPYRGEDAR